MDKQLIRAIHTSLGSAGVTKVFIYLEEMFEKNPDGFFKFQSPCKISAYKVGTSMSEETRWTVSTLQSRLNKICTLYKSRSLYSESIELLGMDGVFQGNPYLRYMDKNSYQTYFRRNQRIVSNIMAGAPLNKAYDVPVNNWMDRMDRAEDFSFHM
jgi:hypothetical protein